jgi:hypothetical protein
MAEYDDFDYAVEEARNEVAHMVGITDEYHTAELVTRIVPLYK